MSRSLAALAATLLAASLLPLGSTSSATAAPVVAQPRGVSTDAGALNPVSRQAVMTARLTANASTGVRIAGLDPDAGGVLVQVSIDCAQGVTVSAGPTSKGPFTPVVTAARGGTWGGTALVATQGSIFLRSTGAATARVTPMAWVAASEPGTQLGAGAIGIAVPVTRVDTAKGFGDTWLSSGRDVQLSGLGGIPSRGASAVIASVTVKPTREIVSLSYTQGSASGTVMTTAAGQALTTLAFLPVDSRGQVKLRTSAAATVTVTPVGWVSRGKYDTRPLGDGAVQPIAPQSLVTGTFPVKKLLAPTAVPAQAGAVPLIALRAVGSGKVTVGPFSMTATTGTVTGLVPAVSRASRPGVASTGKVTGDVVAVGWVATGSLNDYVEPTVSINGAPTINASLKGDGEFILSGTASDASGIARVTVEIPDSNEGYAFADVDPLSNTWSLPYAPPDGTSEILVTAYDRDGNSAEATIVAQVQAADINETLTAANVVMLSSTQREAIGTVSDQVITFTSSTSPVLPGDIISIMPGGKTPDGALRHVLAVSPIAGGGWSVYTMQAVPTDALLQANYGVTDEVRSGVEKMTRTKLLRAKTPRDFTLNPETRLEYSFMREASKSWESKGGAVTANGKVKGTTSGALIVRLQVFVETCWFVPCGGRVDLFQIRFENLTRIDAEVHSQVGKNEKVIEDWALSSPIDTGSFAIGPVPFTTSLQPKGYVDLEANLDVVAWAQKPSALEITYLDSGGWQSPNVDLNQPIEWRLDLNFDGVAEVGIKLTEAVKVAGIAGPSFVLKAGLLGVEGNVSLTIGSMFPDPVCDVQIDVYSKIGLGLGFVAGVGDDPWSVDFFPFETKFPLYSWPKEDLCPDPVAPWWGGIIGNLPGRGVEIQDVSQRGDPLSVVGIDTGYLLSGYLFSTGNAQAIVDPDLVDRGFEALGSYDLDRLFDVKTTDASVTSFELIPEGSTLEIPYRFLSQEYGEEKPDPKSRDVVAILVDGINCAKTKDGRPVNSSTVEPDLDVEEDVPYDGISAELICRIKVTPQRPIPITIVVADVGKDGVDTALYIPWEGISSR